MPRVYTVPDDIALHTGPVLIGIVLNWWLYGILCVQYYLYLSKTKNEMKAIQAIVHSIFILDTFQTFMMMEDAFYWYVYNFGDFAKFNEFHFSAINMALVDAILAFVVQLFYIWRINRLSGWKIIPGIFTSGAMLAFGSGVFIAAADLKFPSDVGFRNDYRVGVIIWLLASAITDILIALCTGYLLLRMAKKRSSKSTGRRIMQILTLTLETNAITSAVALEIVIVYFTKSIAPPFTKIYLPGGFVLGKLYSNCFMILLNQRQNYQDTTVHVYGNSTSGGLNSTTRFGVSSATAGQGVSAISFANQDTITMGSLNHADSKKKHEESSV